jgi:integrase
MAPSNSSKPSSLSAAFVSSVKEPGKYYDGKGNGLFLWVKPNGARFWVQRVTIRRKRHDLGLGSPPMVNLASAREQAFENKRMIRNGGDPLERKRETKSVLSFAEAARKTHKELSPTWKNPKDRAAFLKTLETYIFPAFGHLPLDAVTSADVRQAILAAREKAPSVAKKLTFRVSFVFRWGIAEGLCSQNPATAEALALPRDTRKSVPRKSLHYSKVTECIETIQASGAWQSTKLALEFLILTASRSAEARLARWEEIELPSGDTATCATWTVPADRAKQKRPHRVPLPKRAVEILGAAKTLDNGSGFIFPSVRGRTLSDMTLSKLVKELGYDAHVHGFRTSFRTWAQECTDYPREVQEAALGHKLGDAAEQAYARSDYYQKRRQMMADWASYLADSPTVTEPQMASIQFLGK